MSAFKKGSIAGFPVIRKCANKGVNVLLDKMHAQLLKNLPGAFLIDICEDYVCGETHKWGLNPIHYEPDYYKEGIRQITDAISHFVD